MSIILNRLQLLERVLTAVGFAVLLLVIFGDVVYRELFGSGLHWARQTGVYANLVVIMFGMGLASAHAKHLRPRFADGWLPAAWEPALLRLQDAGMAAFCAAFALLAAIMVADSMALGERSAVLGILIWPVQSIIPVAFALAAIRHGIYAVFPGLSPSDSQTTGAV